MQFHTWEPVYEAILADFGYPRDGDEAARDALGELLQETDTYRPEGVGFDGQTVAIAGAGPSLEAETDRAADADVVVAASVAADRLRDAGIAVDCMVTDLDKNPETGRNLTRAGTPVFVHAHGDNVPAVREYVPTYDAAFVVPTTQAEPTDTVQNFGGFTDGDRAAFVADHFGAERLTFVGWDFDDPDISPEKRRKLDWAERLLYWLERRRNEHFSVLNGRRDDIDPLVSPR
ncbi:6-hydroxymethylpterin diphosphokinase MptE-like protein [Haloarcula amylovorans]|uniref:6-hydroxymethylpterin diphosphokinase MptE-like protein n=1 Tax=Haloarcula amylovorans TaxID=2562280 RepID=UPI0010769249|nr:6-hydroxymethylpterin diphosphokinase MptE-like protein [Halomicroarcula amylolytica]